MAQAPVGGTRKSIRVILEVYVETHPFSTSRGGVSWRFAEISSEARIWTQIAEDRVQSLALSSAVSQFYSVGFLLATVLLNHLSMSDNPTVIFLLVWVQSGFPPNRVKRL